MRAESEYRPFVATLRHRLCHVGLIAAIGLVPLAGCGIGTAAIFGGSSDSKSANTPSTVSSGSLRVADAKDPAKAKIYLVAVDPEGQPATVNFFFVTPTSNGAETPLAQNPVTLATSAAGVEHFIPWNFAAEAGLSAALTKNVTLIARLTSGNSQSALVSLGNDAPEVTVAPLAPNTELSGIAALTVQLSDSSGDLTDLKVEFKETGGAYKPALPRGTGLANIKTPDDGAKLEQIFFWDTDKDLKDLERVVTVRFTPRDQMVDGKSEEIVVRVDNDDVPAVQIDYLFANPDVNRGIPLAYTVTDDESNLVRVLFQWSKEKDRFEDLGTRDPATLIGLLDDPDFVRQKRICRPFPSFARGVASPVAADPQQVHLPELAQNASGLRANGVELRELELLRPNRKPARVAATWTNTTPLAPAAALPLRNGVTALVAENTGATSRLIELTLATGEIVRTVASGLVGTPTAMSFESSRKSVLIATDFGGAWQLYRVTLATGNVASLLAKNTSPAGPLRGVVSIGTGVALATAGDGLWRLEFSDPTGPRAIPLVRGLRTPWGLAVDPIRQGRVFVAERDATITGLAGIGRISSFDRHTKAMDVVAARAAINGRVAFPAVTALALDRRGERLVALCQPGVPGDRELFGFNIGTTQNTVFSLGTVAADANSIATGEANLLLVALPTTKDLAVGGGIEQSRTMSTFNAVTATATVTAAFAPSVRNLQPWRISTATSFRSPIHGSPTGKQGVFVWDCRDIGIGTSVFLKATCMDSETGTAAESRVGRAVSGIAFADQQRLKTGTNPQSIATADLDGDGDLDFVTANSASDNLTVFYQDAPRTFTPQPNLNAGDFPAAVVAADLDRDGDMDLVTANARSNNLTVFFQDAPRTFTARPAINTGISPRSLTAADLDGDGDIDLVVASFGSNDITVLFQDAPRTFTAQPRIATGVSPTAVIAADLDGDGDLDLTVANSASNNLTVFFQDAARTFTAQPPIAVGTTPESIVAADLDGDGDLDLATANSGSRDVTVLFQDTPRVFGADAKVPPLKTNDAPRSLIAADIDGDGDMDLAGVYPARSTITMFFQEGPRSFAVQPAVPLSLRDTPFAIASGDLDGDGDLDLITANSGSDDVTVLFQGSTQTFSAGTPLGFSHRSVSSADLDGDGDIDLLAGDAALNCLTVYLQDAPRTFSAQPALSTGQRPFSVAAADLDGDGQMDLVSANIDSDDVSIFFRDPKPSGTGFNYTPIPAIKTGDEPYSVAAADLDGDGDLDLAVANRASDNLTILFQDAPRAFAAQPPLATGDRPEKVVAADLDGDGDMDLVVANFGTGDELSLYFQDAPRTFTPQPPLKTGGSGAGSVVVLDLDGDGDMDLACANSGTNNVTVFFQDAPRVFTANTRLDTGVDSSPRSLAAADLDGDGDLDLVAGNEAGRSLSMFYQDAPRTFTARPTFMTNGFLLNTVIATDLDSDGDMDLVTTNSKLKVFFGR